MYEKNFASYFVTEADLKNFEPVKFMLHLNS